MGIFDKLMFWKQPDEILTPNNAGLDINNMPDLNNPNSGMPNMNSMDQQLGLNNMDPGLPPQDPSQNSMMPQAFGQQKNFEQQNTFQNSSPQSFQQPAFSNSSDMQKDIQILSLKLDAIKSSLDSLNQRVANIERIAENEQVKQTQTQKRWY